MKQFCSITIGIFFVCLISSCDYYFIEPHKEHVGFIPHTGFLEPEEFPPCFPEKIFPYYYGRSRAGFEHGLDSLKTKLFNSYNNFGNTSITGYITIRFLINCQGEVGRFEIKSLGTDYKKKKLDIRVEQHLVDAIKELRDWKPIVFNDDNYDSFYHLTFKIINGELKAILP
ncbi:MAG: hypothetical protein HKN09_05820 [Saprospiraceae bacterium]|nr:hypothetical protein [Saprospiraceae bacterium]